MTVTHSVRDVLDSFDRLSPQERAIVVREIAKRVKDDHGDGRLADEEMSFLTDQMFQMYDVEEERNGSA